MNKAGNVPGKGAADAYRAAFITGVISGSIANVNVPAPLMMFDPAAKPTAGVKILRLLRPVMSHR